MYYVVSNGDEPFQIFFTFEEASSTRSKYIDVFDKGGIKIKTYKLNYDTFSNFYVAL